MKGNDAYGKARIIEDHPKGQIIKAILKAGGVIMIDNEVVFEHIPQAYCFGNNSISDYDLLKLACEKLGQSLEIEYVSVDEYEGDED